MTPAIQTLFNCLSDGLAIIAPDGTVRFVNRGILGLLPVVLGRPLPNPVIATAIEQAQGGHLPLPHSFEIELIDDRTLSEPDRIQCHIVRSPAGKDLVLVLRNLTEATLYETTLANLGTLIDRSLLEPLEDFSTKLGVLIGDVATAMTMPPACSNARTAC